MIQISKEWSAKILKMVSMILLEWINSNKYSIKLLLSHKKDPIFLKEFDNPLKESYSMAHLEMEKHSLPKHLPNNQVVLSMDYQPAQ